MAAHVCKLVHNRCQSVFKNCNQKAKIFVELRRGYQSKELKRFYKNVRVTQADDCFEINLDKSKLKTPMGKLFQVPSEPLALAVATEWDSQQKIIERHTMHLTSLCNTVLDNPTYRSKDTAIKGILEFLATDTICYRLAEPIELEALQKREWDPLLKWIKDRYDVVLEPTTGIAAPNVPQKTIDIFTQRLISYSDWALVGFQQIVEAVKSLVITIALVDRYITVERAVWLSRLEQEFQIHRWGNVEWHHDIDVQELQARVAAATLLIHWCTESSSRKYKMSLT